jgi:hypothetical protein
MKLGYKQTCEHVEKFESFGTRVTNENVIFMRNLRAD